MVLEKELPWIISPVFLRLLRCSRFFFSNLLFGFSLLFLGKMGRDLKKKEIIEAQRRREEEGNDFWLIDWFGSKSLASHVRHVQVFHLR